MFTGAKKSVLWLSLLCGLPLMHAALSTPRTWAVAETPVAFWSWRAQTPTAAELEQAQHRTGAVTLFQRAGQFDYEQGQVRRIRAVAGEMPRNTAIHLVYNATPALLSNFAEIEPTALARVAAETFTADLARAAGDGACVNGLQLDIDAPTRLLPRYGAALRLLRAQLLPGMKLSITGLPTWMESPTIGDLLDEVDFWIPQFYGAVIPDRIDQPIPIASPAAVRRAVVRARDLRRPFYAGLAAYSYAILYSSVGARLEVRGDLNPALIAAHPQFELIENGPFDGQSGAAWRYVCRALRDEVIDGLVIKRGEQLLLDVPSTATLRACARAVREEAGAQLLGICVFRLPDHSDLTTLTAAQIGAALADQAASIATTVKIERVQPALKSSANQLRIEAVNTGSTGARFGDGALTLDLGFPQGGLRGIINDNGLFSYEAFCGGAALRPCSLRRATLLRLKARAWPPGAYAQPIVDFVGAPPIVVPLKLSLRTDDGRAWQEYKEITINRESGQ